MDEDNGMIQADEVPSLTQLLETKPATDRIGPEHSREDVCAKAEGSIAVIERRTFIRECIRRSMRSAFQFNIHAFSDAGELREKCCEPPKLIVLSEIEYSRDASAHVFMILSQIAPRIPIIVLAYNNDAEAARAAVSYGAKGYIPVTLGFDIAIEAVRFVLAGGTYVPIDYLLMTNWSGDTAPETPPAPSAVTSRELAVVRAIQRGKSNKIIAYELGMCESTVKVHVRRIMKKLKAKNRTEVAVKSTEIIGPINA